MWQWLAFVGSVAVCLMGGAEFALWWMRRNPPAGGSPTPEEARVHTQAQADRAKVNAQAQDYQTKVEGMSHDELAREINRPGHGGR